MKFHPNIPYAASDGPTDRRDEIIGVIHLCEM